MDWPRSSRFLIISQVAILKEILTYLGTLLTSNTLKELYELLGINWASAQTTVYHPQSDGLMERLNKSLKSMIHNFIHEDERNWARCLDPLLFTVQEVPQAFTGFSPFELLFSRKPQEVLELIKENSEESPNPAKNEIQYVLDQRAKLHILWGKICSMPRNISTACTTEGLDSVKFHPFGL